MYSAEHTIIAPQSHAKVSTEISILVTTGTYGRIAPRSGLAMKHSIDIAAGVLNADYRGPVIVGLVNDSNLPFEGNVGDRIAQFILECIQMPEISKVDSLPETERGNKGFGSTGVAETPILDRRVMAVQTRNTANSEWTKLILEAGAKDEQWSSVRSVLMSGKLIDTLSLQDDLVLFKHRIYLPDCNDLKLTVTRQVHDAKVAGHFGRDKTMELLTGN